MALLRVQERLKPYKSESNNRIEMVAIVAALFTLYSSLIFVVEEGPLDGFYFLCLVLVFLVNIFFIVNWVYLMLESFRKSNKHIKNWMDVISNLLKLKKANEMIEEKVSHLNISKPKRLKKVFCAVIVENFKFPIRSRK
jgi:uncharacterized membrane protein